MQIRHRSRIWTLILVLIASIAAGNVAIAQSDGTGGATPDSSPVAGGGLETATTWLIGQQGEEGGFVGFSGGADPGTTIDAIFGLIAAQHAGIDTQNSIDKAVAYLESSDIALVYTQTGVGQAAKLALVLSALGRDPHNLANVDPLAILEFGQNADTGMFGLGPYDHAMALLALSAAGETIPVNAISALEASQAENGGWGYDGSTDDAMVDSNTTAMVIQAIAASGQPDPGLKESGLAFLEQTLRDGAGAAYNVDLASLADSNSTALVAQAVLASGDDPSAPEWQDLISALLGFQNTDGSFGYQATVSDPNLLSTAQALPVLAGLAFPLPSIEGSNATPVGNINPLIWQQAA